MLAEQLAALVSPQPDPVLAGSQLQQLASLEPQRLPELLQELHSQRSLLPHSDPAILGALLLLIQQLATRETIVGENLQRLRTIPPETIVDLLDALPGETLNRYRLLYLLAAARSNESLRLLALQLHQRPPQQWSQVAQVLSPLMQHNDWQTAAFFPPAIPALEHRSVAAPLLDLANYVSRHHQVTPHPATDYGAVLTKLLGEVVGRLGRFEDNPRAFGDTVDQVQSVLDEAVAIAVSLCDALGLIGSEEAIGKLNQAMELRHRRVQTEAAGALARLQQDHGRQRLLELVQEPAARLRVLAYADELGFADQVDDTYRTDIARAEAELALWLSQPHQMGVPPTRLEVIDSRLLYWPSYEQPIDCFLVRFEYDLGPRQYSNIGIVGPTVHAIAADLADLPIDDIYAVYAGWHVEHAEIFSVASEHWNAAQRRLAQPLIEVLDRQGFESIKPQSLGIFLGENALVVKAQRDDVEFVVITDGLETIDQPTAGRARPLQPIDLWHLYLGRKMLRTFNA